MLITGFTDQAGYGEIYLEIISRRISTGKFGSMCLD